jgi:Polyketide cyclase / dehydrase and lipid transport
MRWRQVKDHAKSAVRREGQDHEHERRSRKPCQRHSLARRLHARGCRPVFSQRAFINASCQRVWRHIVEATRWPEWYPNSKAVQVLGDSGAVLEDNSIFRWTTFGLPLESRINEFVPFSRIGWFGYAPGSAPSFYHTWYLTQVGAACGVVTEEVGREESAIRFRQADESAMHRGHDLWLATLKWVSESNSSEE